MATLEKAIEIAARAHSAVRDKQGTPYILHPIRVMLGVESEAAQIVAVLHDVIEDTEVTIGDIRSEGFSQPVLDALQLVTHRPDQPYSDYVVACGQNEIARQVKISDLRDNASLSRVLLRPEAFDRDTTRINRYILSYRFLNNELSEGEYRTFMGHCQ